MDSLQKLRSEVNSSKIPVMRMVKNFEDLLMNDLWVTRYPEYRYQNYYDFLRKYSNRPVTIDRVLTNGAIIVEETSVAIGIDVLEDKEVSYLPEELFEVL